MKPNYLIRLLILYFLFQNMGMTVFGQKLTKDKKQIIKSLEATQTEYNLIAQEIWGYAELGYLETKSTTLLQENLKKNGFEVTTGIADIPTAFVASYGSGQPVIAILGEFDALPGVSQAAVPYRQAVVEYGNGHACGHHLFGAGSAAAAVAVKNWLKDNKKKGTIRFYGTPAEEGGAGKVYMARAGAFDDVDVVLHWHPSSQNSANAASSLANKSAKFRFKGIAAHASAAPDKGISALDGVEAMNYMTNLLREHIPSDSRIHYVITSGGEAPNVVPEFAEVFYYVRHPEMDIAKQLFKKIVKAAKGAALGTGTTVDYEVIHGCFNVLPNETLARVMHKNMTLVGGVHYDEKETEFATQLMKTYPTGKATIADASRILPFKVIEKGRGGSTDVGDVSWQVPTAGCRTATWTPGTSAHTWQAVAAGGMSIGKKGMLVASKTMALTALDIFNNPKLVKQAKKELIRRRGKDFKYEAMLGDRKPPLDYRK